MSVTFIHTADWQIGKPFAGIADDTKRILVQQERIKCVERIGGAAREHGAEFILVAGDLFDSPTPTRDTVAATCAAIGGIGLPVLVIPGNHDHGGPGGVWEQSFFLGQRDQRAPNLQVLLKPEPLELDTAVIFPCPLVRRHETDDTTAWLRDLDLSRFGAKPRIVLAHGSVQGFTSDLDEEDLGGSRINRIELDRLPAEGFDYVALGDWHGTKKMTATAWYSGTPEIDRFPKGEDNRPGHVLVVTAARGAPPEVVEARTAGLGWHPHTFSFAEDASLEVLKAELNGLFGAQAQRDLLLLMLNGSLGLGASAHLEERLEGWEAGLLRLKLANNTTIAPTEEEVAALTQRAADPLISRVAARLVEEARAENETGRIARLALRELHAACADA